MGEDKQQPTIKANMSAKAKTKAKKKSRFGANLVWFEIPADKPDRAKKFYSSLFGWKINPFPQMADYSHIDTGGPDDSPDGGLMARMHPGHQITVYINVPSVTRAVAKIQKLGGSVCKAKTAVPGMGYFAICNDTENNTFAVWEMSDRAK
jgi:predicted enzyme related to lactoylglutathione lyase